MTGIKSTRIIANGKIISGTVCFENGKIVSVSDSPEKPDQLIDVGDSYVSAGFIDIHTHGGCGCDFSKGTLEVIEGANFHLKHGTTSICPTISAMDFCSMAHAVEYVEAAMADGRTLPNIIGAHLEGPYLSKEQCGAQCPTFIKAPDPAEYEELVEKHGDAIARWTYAPENDDGSFAKYVSERGINVSAGHTNAIYADMERTIANGCNIVTHLYSCTSTVTREFGFRRLGVIETALLRDDIYAEIIADGKHLPADLIKLILKAKGTDKVALVTDSLELAGVEACEGVCGVTEYIIEDGVCKLKDRSAFAGSIATADRLVRVVRDEAGVPITEAIKMITAVPAEILGLNKGDLAPGLDADIVVFDDGINVEKVFVMGECKYEK
jgi:N-acetylglucosamine-6-phosphate deacetylase